MPRKYTREQREKALELLQEVGNIAQVSRDLGIHRDTLVEWRKQALIDSGKGPAGALTTQELQELRRLRRENRTLRMERDFLKKAIAFFDREDSSSGS